jgi:DNA-binding response OmpR family regulator
VLGGMDGRQLAMHVTRERPDARVLFMSGYARGVGPIAGGLDLGTNLIEKPFTAHALLTKTRQVLGIHGDHNELATSGSQEASPSPETDGAIRRNAS